MDRWIAGGIPGEALNLEEGHWSEQPGGKCARL